MDGLNSENRIEIRRHHNQLKVTSNGVLILGAWSLMKAFLTSFTDTAQTAIPRPQTAVEIIIVVIMYIIFLAIDLRLRLIVWRGARKEAYGRDTNNRYIVMTVILLLVSAVSLASMGYSLIKTHDSIPTQIASILIEIASFAILIELLYSSHKIRRIRSEISIQKEEAI